jgi:pyruvate ferredoxin oxidoreductase beta subunit
MASIKNLPDEELVYGSLACAGCGGNLALRIALKVLGKKTVIVTSPCCVMGSTTFLPQLAIEVPCVTAILPGTAAVMTGIAAGLKRRNEQDANVVGFVGDGGTLDIGLQSLSGAMERGERFIYICYDNEAYMNTGNQRSGSSPLGAYTTSTPGGEKKMWKEQSKKDMLRIVAAHNIAYAATASIAYINDYTRKVEKAMEARGPAYIQVLSPCPPGWGYEPNNTIQCARLAVQTGMWVLQEYQQGNMRLTMRPAKRKPITEYLKAQDRFSLLGPEDIQSIQEATDYQWETYYGRLESSK